MNLTEPIVRTDGIYTTSVGVNCNMFAGPYKLKEMNLYIEDEFKRIYPNISLSTRIRNRKDISASLYVTDSDILTLDEFEERLKNSFGKNRGLVRLFNGNISLLNRIGAVFHYLSERENNSDFEKNENLEKDIPIVKKEIEKLYTKTLKDFRKSYREYGGRELPILLVHSNILEAGDFLDKAYQSFLWHKADFSGECSNSSFYYNIEYIYKPLRRKVKSQDS